MTFIKSPKTFDEQITLLIERGMVIDDVDRAKRYLTHINYYRLAAYWLPFERDHSTHQFQTDTNFNAVLNHYIFDRELRLLVMDAIERIEISLRTQWAYHLAHAYGPHAYLNTDIHKESWPHRENVQFLKDAVVSNTEAFVRHVDNYGEELPPMWSICEIMTLGQLSKWFSNLRHSRDRNVIANSYGLDEVNLVSFLHHLSIVRNICAHHSRLWNREFVFKWKLPQKKPKTLFINFNMMGTNRLYNTLVMLAHLMDSINPHSWKQRICFLFNKYPEVSNFAMGFPGDWTSRPIWAESVVTSVDSEKCHNLRMTNG